MKIASVCPMHRVGIAALWLWLLSSFAVSQPVAPQPRNILLLSSYSQNYTSAEQLQAGLDDVLQHRSGSNILYIEYFDSARIPDEDAGRYFAEHLNAKYQDVEIDHVVAWHISAISFLELHPELFPGSEITYFEGPPLSEEAPPNWFSVPQDFDDSLAEVERLYKPEKLYVILDLSDANGQTRMDNFENARLLHMPEVAVEYLTDRPLQETADFLQQLQEPRAAAIYLLTFTDAQGQPSSPQAAYRYLAERSAVPIFSFWQTLMGQGLVGGHVFSHRQAGRSLGRIILSSQANEAGAEFDTHLYMYDWSLMKKWGIDTDLIRADATVINKPENIFHTYRYQLMAIGAVLALLAGLSVKLAKTVHLRNQALAALDLERQGLEHKVAERTQDLSQKNEELQNTLSEVKTLKGFIPICSYCKHVRDDEGYWEQVEAYISSQTDARFSHGICPDCTKLHFPGISLVKNQ